MIEKLKKWNWGALLFCFCIGNIGALANSSFDTTLIALAAGSIFGLVFGLIIAYATRKD